MSSSIDDKPISARPAIRLSTGPAFSSQEIAQRRKEVGTTLRCPYCDVPLTQWTIPATPFSEWDAGTYFVCFHSDCPFTVRSLAVMEAQGVRGVGYRLLYNQERDRLTTVPDSYFGYPRG